MAKMLNCKEKNDTVERYQIGFGQDSAINKWLIPSLWQGE